MIYNNDCTLPKEYLEQLTTEGLESLPEMIRILVNEAMQIERDKHLKSITRIKVFSMPDREVAETHLKKTVEKYALIAPKLADWMEVNIPEGFTVFSFPRAHQKRLRTSNYLGRFSQEIKRCTRVVRVFPNEQSCLRLI